MVSSAKTNDFYARKKCVSEIRESVTDNDYVRSVSSG